MPEFVSAYADGDGNTVVSVPAGFAKAAGLHTLKEPATDANGRPLGPREGHRGGAKKAAATPRRKRSAKKTSAVKKAAESNTPPSTSTGGEADPKPEEAS